MSQIKDDLICEIIRVSQTNLLGRKRSESEGDCDEQVVLSWIKENAARYRKDFKVRLDSYSASELGSILDTLTHSQKHLSEVLSEPSSSGPQPRLSN